MGHSKSIVWLTTQLHELTKHVRNNTEDCERQDQLLDTLHQRLDEVDARICELEHPDTATPIPQVGDLWVKTAKNGEPIARTVERTGLYIHTTEGGSYYRTQGITEFVDSHTLVWRDGKRWDGA